MSVETKLLGVMLQVSCIAPDRQMPADAGGYMYLSEDQLTSKLHPLFAELGLLIYPIGMSIISESDIPSGNKTARYVRIEARYRIIDAEDHNSYIDVVALGEGSDNRDKAISKALTNAYKAALLQTLMISTGSGSGSPQAGQGRKTAVCVNDGCGVVLTPGQREVSMKTFGKPLCVNCQKVAKASAAKPADPPRDSRPRG